MSFLLKNKFAVVTGGSGGIGRAVVKDFVRKGAKVLFSYCNNEDGAKKVVSELTSEGFSVKYGKLNVSKKEEVRSFFKEALSSEGKIDILVNNAGINKDSFLMMMKDDDWQEVLNTNLNGVYYCSKAVVRSMIGAKKGRIINIVSHSALTGRQCQVNYAASKGGIVAMTRSLARELAPFNILVNAVSPGLVNTDMLKTVPEKELELVKSHIPLKRIANPEEIAPLISFLSSDESSYITGQVIRVDGGLLI